MEPYCSGECQKSDWKKHKLICDILKRLSNDLQPYQKVVKVIMEILEMPASLRILSHLLCYAEFQFGERVAGKAYRQRGNGEKIDNLTVEIRVVISIYRSFLSVYDRDTLLNQVDRDNLKIPYFLKMQEMLKPWSLCLDSESQNDSLSQAYIDYLWEILAHTESSIAMIYMSTFQLDISESYFLQSLAYARRLRKECGKKTLLMHLVLSTFCQLRNIQQDFDGAVILAEEAYNNVAEAYNPVHPKVMEAAGTLIQTLTYRGDLYDAERYGQVTLDNLRDPANGVDQNTEAVARGCYNLANVIYKQDGDFVKAELLVREAYRIWQELYEQDHAYIREALFLLCNLLNTQGKLGDEVKELNELCLAFILKLEGSDAKNTAVWNVYLGGYHHQLAEIYLGADRKEQLRLSLTYFKEAVRIHVKIMDQDASAVVSDFVSTAHKMNMISKLFKEA